MTNQYVKIPAIYKKLKVAEANQQVLYISAPICYGKTAAVQYYYRNKKYLLISVDDGQLPDMPDMTQIEQSVVVIDNISWITDVASMDYIRQLIQKHQKQLILIGRSKMPAWLKGECINQRFLIATDKDLIFSTNETIKLLATYGITKDEGEANCITKDSQGFVLCIQMIAYHMSTGEPYSVKILQAARRDIFHYFDTGLYVKWTCEMQNMMLSMVDFSSFDEEMVSFITENGEAAVLLERAQAVGNFLILNEDRMYQIHPFVAEYLRWKQALVYTENKRNEIYKRAAQYYDSKNNRQAALCYYAKCNDQEKISELLIKNAENHAGTAHFFETREYYQSLPDDFVKQSPVLMAGMSMMHSMLLQVEESNHWYDALEEYEKNQPKNSHLKKEAKCRLAYLDIALPQLGTVRTSEILKKAAIFCTSSHTKLPEFSVTSNLPSVMNGGKDFCEWSKKDQELARTLKKPVELLLGKYGAGLVDVALAESTFEKNSLDTYEIMTLLNSGYLKADAKGKIEMCFAAIGILVKLYISRGQYHVAESTLNNFLEKAQNEQAVQLYTNIKAMKIWLKLLVGDRKSVAKWLEEEAPDENREFYILERYRYLMKVRAYIAMGRLLDAANLIERLQVYVNEYERNYISIENHLLKAVLQYRMREGNWNQSLTTALQIAEEYHFIRVVAQEGNAIWPLLEKADLHDISDSYQKEIKKEVNGMASVYPKYLKDEDRLAEPLTEMEKRVLKLLCKGESLQKICDTFSISYSTVKYHNRNIYRKLNVKNRQEAQAIASELGYNKTV